MLPMHTQRHMLRDRLRSLWLAYDRAWKKRNRAYAKRILEEINVILERLIAMEQPPQMEPVSCPTGHSSISLLAPSTSSLH